MKKQFSVEKDVPVPGSNDDDNLYVAQPKYERYPVEHLEEGDSFFVPNESPYFVTGYYYKALKLGLKHHYRRREVVEAGVRGTRVWRMPDDFKKQQSYEDKQRIQERKMEKIQWEKEVRKRERLHDKAIREHVDLEIEQNKKSGS